MQRLTTSSAHTSRLWRLLCDLRIRQLLLLVFCLLSLITVSALSWNAIQVFKQYGEAERMSGINAIAQRALALNAVLARERGFTAALLAQPNSHNLKTQQQLSLLQEDSDQDLRLLYKALGEHS